MFADLLSQQKLACKKRMSLQSSWLSASLAKGLRWSCSGTPLHISLHLDRAIPGPAALCNEAVLVLSLTLENHLLKMNQLYFKTVCTI